MQLPAGLAGQPSWHSPQPWRSRRQSRPRGPEAALLHNLAAAGHGSWQRLGLLLSQQALAGSAPPPAAVVGPAPAAPDMEGRQKAAQRMELLCSWDYFRFTKYVHMEAP